VRFSIQDENADCYEYFPHLRERFEVAKYVGNFLGGRHLEVNDLVVNRRLTMSVDSANIGYNVVP
jgi:hypothetical protein